MIRLKGQRNRVGGSDVIVIGPLPPPYHGAAKNTEVLAKLFGERCAVTQLNNMTDHCFTIGGGSCDARIIA
jgi:hypothetical protein